MVIDNMTRESCIFIDSVKLVMIVPVLFIILGLGHALIRIRLIWHT